MPTKPLPSHTHAPAKLLVTPYAINTWDGTGQYERYIPQPYEPIADVGHDKPRVAPIDCSGA